MNGITHDIFLDYSMNLFCFLVNLSYVSNKNIWKRIRTGLFDLIFWVSDSSDMCETHPTSGSFSDFGFRVSRGSRDWIESDVACGLGFDFGSDEWTLDRDTCFGDSVDSVDSDDLSDS